MTHPLIWCALVALPTLVALPSAVLAQTCYSMPFTRISDPWGCGSACGRSTPHRGVDFPAATGTPIPAIADGIVHVPRRSSCLGNVVVIEHPDGMWSGYAHMNTAPVVAHGSTVSRGTTIGYVGATGSSPDCVRGAHLHMTLGPQYESYFWGATVDPVAYIRANEAGVNCAEGAGLLSQQTVAYAPPSTTDLDGDGRGDLCARANDGVHCYLARGSGEEAGWEETDAVVPWSDASGWDDVANYATLRMGDIDGDGLADLCARGNRELVCALSTGTGLATPSAWQLELSDASGWDVPEHYTTLRLADVNGDGREDLCARSGTGFGCWLSDGASFNERIEGPRWSNAEGYTRAEYYGTLRMGDLNADGLADVCIRGEAGVSCALSEGNGFSETFAGPAWSDARGFDAVRYWSTMRLADVNGDRHADLCVRTSTDLRCVLSTDDGFGDTVIVAELADASGWADASNFRSLRVGDINGDGAQDLCARADAGIRCWSWDGAEFVQSVGPEWSDASSWNRTPAYYDTIRLTDFDGDGRSDVCARAAAGWRCALARGDGFADTVTSDRFANAQSWDSSPRYWSTILSGGHCVPVDETCNGRDDDCDGLVDNGTCLDAGPADLDAGAAGLDASPSPGDAGTTGPPDDGLSGGCGCRVEGAPASPAGLAALVFLLALVVRRRGFSH